MLYKVATGKRLILASQSPRRYELLTNIGLEISVEKPHVDEDVDKDLPGERQVINLARLKAKEVAYRKKDAWILAADTLVVYKNEILGKPANILEARSMLRKLSGKSHSVLTGFCIYNREQNIEKWDVVKSKVRFRKLTYDEIDAYLNTNEAFDKAGAYGIQGLAAAFVDEIEGSYTNIVGLPLSHVISEMLELKVILPKGNSDE